MKNRIITGVTAVLAGLLISLGPQTIFSLDAKMSSGSWMLCHWTGRAEIGAGLVIAVLGILLLIFSSREIRLGLSFGIAASDVLALLLPAVLIGGCGMPDMKCQSVTFPALYIITGLTLLGAVFNIIYLLLSISGRTGKAGKADDRIEEEADQ
jgi:hypothetical protein